MIDFINRGINRKVNFVILPALFSNGSLLENGKYWVFTFSKNTFKFEDKMNGILNNLLKNESLDTEFIKDILAIEVIFTNYDDRKYVDIITNIDIPEDIEHEFIFYFSVSNKKQKFHSKQQLKHFKIQESWENFKYEFILEDKIVISINNVININSFN